MSALQIPETVTPYGVAIEPEHQEHPRLNGGVLLDGIVSPLPQYDLSVVERNLVWERTMRGIGNFKRYEVTFDDGSHYQEQRCEPLTQRYERGVTMTTPWWTRIPGYNTEVQKELAQNGMASDLVGPPEFKLSLRALRGLFGNIQLSHDAAVQLTLYKDAAADGLFDGQELLSTGYSRGGMVLWYLLAYEKQYGLNINYFDSNDPCLVESISLEDVNFSELETYLYPLREFLAGARAIGRHSLQDIIKIAKTLDRKRHPLLQHIAVGAALLEGQAGYALDHIDPTKTGSVRLYDRSLGNQGGKLKARLAQHPHIYFADRIGLHMSGMSRPVRQAAVGRLVLAQDFIDDGRPLKDVDFTKLARMTDAA